MNPIRKLFDETKAVWSEASRPARAGFVSIAVLLLTAVGAVGWYSWQPQYVPLATSLSPAEAAELVSKLNAEGIDNQLNFSGSSVMVSKSDWSRARLVAGDLAGPAPMGQPEFEESLMSDPTLNRYRIQRNREKGLAQAIAARPQVKSATVHIAEPEPALFVKDVQPTTASVVLELERGVVLTREHIASITALVANSVQGLMAEDVAVTDTRGRLLTSSSSATAADFGGQYEFRRQLESDLSSKAETMLTEMLGPGHAVVRVTADLDFTQTTRKLTTYDPDSKVKKTETVKSTSKTGSRPDSGGAAGIAGNVGALAGSNQSTDLNETTEENTTEYLTPETVDTVQEASGTIRRLTVAATVDLSGADGGADSSAAGVAGGKLTKEQVESIIQQAVGFDETRNDRIEVVIAPLVGLTDSGPIVPLPPFDWPTVLRNASLGTAALTALLLGFLTLRRMKPVVVGQEEEQRSATANPERLGELLLQARSHPETVARIIGAWMGEVPENPEEATDEGETAQEVQEQIRAAA